MATELTTVSWEKSLSLNRPKSTTPALDLLHLVRPPSQLSKTLPPIQNNKSFLYSQKLKQELDESRKAFLNLTCNEDEPETQEEKNITNIPKEIKKTPTKKISFKIRKTSSICRRKENGNQKIAISANRVSEIASKFNEMSSENKDAENFVHRGVEKEKLFRKVSAKNTPVTRKPSVKTKPAFTLDEKKVIIVKRRPITVRKASLKQDSEQICVRDKLDETDQTFMRPKSFPINSNRPKSPPKEGTVRKTIEIFERKTSLSSKKPVPKPKVPIKKLENKTDFDEVQIINIPPMLPQRRCDSMHETLHNKKIMCNIKSAKSEEVLKLEPSEMKPNTSFLWSLNQDKSPQSPTAKDQINWQDHYDVVNPPKPEPPPVPAVPPRPPSIIKSSLTLPLKKINKPKMPLPDEKIYEELNKEEDVISHSYEYCENQEKYEKIETTDDGYEYCGSPNNENIYETLPVKPSLTKQQEPLPPRPPSRNNNTYNKIQTNGDNSNCYESIYNPITKKDVDTDFESNYESIYECQIRFPGSNRDSLVSSDQQSNSLYGRASLVGWGDDGSNTYNGKANSDLSGSDKSDDWIDMTDNEDNVSSGFIIIRERQKPRKAFGWSQQIRDQWSKSPKSLPSNEGCDSDDTDHHYETLESEAKYNKQEINVDEFDDSFDSDTESELSYKLNLNDSGVDIANSQLPEPPHNQHYVFTRLAATARKLRRNWSMTKNDISKSLSRMTKKKSRTDLDTAGTNKSNNDEDTANQFKQNEEQNSPTESEASKNLTRSKGFLSKIRRSMSLTPEVASELTSNLDSDKPKSTFYLTQDIDIDKCESETSRDSGASLSPVQRPSRYSVIRPQRPPPPVPTNNNNNNIINNTNNNKKRSTSWYAEVGLFKNSTEHQKQRTNTFWYAEVGLYDKSGSTPSTSSAENSGTNTNTPLKPDDFINQENSEELNNYKNGSEHYSLNSFSSIETKKDNSLTRITPDIQLRLKDEPLYQFYDAAVLDSVCSDGISDLDSDDYEDIELKNHQSDIKLSSRPSAMELVAPIRNSISFSRTLWCEIPEVIQSSVLSSLSSHQKKLQEAKFEMITSEASYLNSLSVLQDHFIRNFKNLPHILSEEDFDILFGKVDAVKNCSSKLLLDLEKCWQDNILLNGVIDIVQKHAEENFNVYISYCENQVLFDDILRKLKDKPESYELLRQLESSSACQSLTLYSFLMLPMQRITRWPLLVDAVLKRLCPQDTEYLTCQYALATLSKITKQCNEATQNKERAIEMKKICNQLEFAKGIPSIDINIEGRYLVKSGTVIHMQQRNDEIKLTFGRRFTKVTLHLFLFNDLLVVTKPKSENLYTIIHYCARNFVELNDKDMLLSLPIKDSQAKNLLFLTLLENQNEKTVEFLISCGSETDKERWTEALSPPKSDDPNETLYECWDCPQVIVKHNYIANQNDELTLNKGDVLNVLKKTAEGWYHGERIRDGQIGWFPANYTAEIANPHVRSKNLKQRYRLLAFSENYLKTK